MVKKQAIDKCEKIGDSASRWNPRRALRKSPFRLWLVTHKLSLFILMPQGPGAPKEFRTQAISYLNIQLT